MIAPTLEDLLLGVADALEADVLPSVGDAAARGQLSAALGIIRRAAKACDEIGPYLAADNTDIETTLDALAPVLGRPSRTATNSAPHPHPRELRERNRALQSELISAQQAVAQGSPTVRGRTEPILVALYERMLAREAEINRSSWGR